MDIEMTKKCARMMGIEVFEFSNDAGTPPKLWCDWRGTGNQVYDPLHDDAQAFALLKHFDLGRDKVGMEWHVWRSGHSGDIANANLNHAICECVSKMVKP